MLLVVRDRTSQPSRSAARSSTVSVLAPSSAERKPEGISSTQIGGEAAAIARPVGRVRRDPTGVSLGRALPISASEDKLSRGRRSASVELVVLPRVSPEYVPVPSFGEPKVSATEVDAPSGKGGDPSSGPCLEHGGSRTPIACSESNPRRIRRSTRREPGSAKPCTRTVRDVPPPLSNDAVTVRRRASPVLQTHASGPYRYRLEIKRFGEQDFVPAPNAVQVRREIQPLASSDGYVRLASASSRVTDSDLKVGAMGSTVQNLASEEQAAIALALKSTIAFSRRSTRFAAP